MRLVEDEKESVWRAGVGAFGWILVLLAWVYAVVIGNGSELQRLAPIILLSGIGSILLLVVGRTVSLGTTIVVAVAAGYFLWRTATSPVWDEARRDVLLVSSAVTCFFAARVALQSRVNTRLFLMTTLVILGGCLIVGGYQALVDIEFKVFRMALEGERTISGLVFHRNYLAGILEIGTPVWLAVALTTKKPFERLFFLLASAASVLLCFFSLSRGGFAALSIGVVVTFVVVFISKWPTMAPKAKKLSLVSLPLGVLTLGVLFFLWTRVLGERNSGMAVDLLGEFKGRLVMSGVAFDIWQTSPVFGSGSQSFGFLFTQHYSADLHGGFLGYARMAHNEYVQTLAEYGLVGFVLLGLLIVWFGSLVIRRMREEPGDWKIAAFAGALGAELLRSTMDFNLHLAPSLVLFALVAGGLANGKPQEGIKRGFFARGLGILVVLSVAGFGVFSFQNELRAASYYVIFDRARIAGDLEKASHAREKVLAVAPEFRLLREHARDNTPSEADPWNEAALLRAAGDWEKVLQRHPYDGESLANLARVLDKLGRFEESEDYHKRAILAAGNRERKYGVFYGYAHHLVYRSHVARSGRKPGEALFLLAEAEQLVQYTISQRYDETEAARLTLQWIQEQIAFLNGARIEKNPVEMIDWRTLAEN